VGGRLVLVVGIVDPEAPATVVDVDAAPAALVVVTRPLVVVPVPRGTEVVLPGGVVVSLGTVSPPASEVEVDPPGVETTDVLDVVTEVSGCCSPSARPVDRPAAARTERKRTSRRRRT
jgi:hypothetical protein